MKKRAFTAFLAALFCIAPARTEAAYISLNAEKHLGKPYVVLVSIDGYRHDYTDRFRPRHLQRLRITGSSAEALIPVFPSKTFTNHYSIATGLYAEHHGIISNRFFDPELNKTFQVLDRSTVEDGRFYGGLPLWAAAAKAAMVSAVYFWPGSEAEIAGFRPSRYFLFDAKVTARERVDQALTWLRLPEDKRPHLLLLYFSAVDRAGHLHGTDSKEVREAVRGIDDEIGRLLDGIEESGLPVNIVVVSDHGMLDFEPDKFIFLDDLADFTDARVIPASHFALIYSENKDARERIYTELSSRAEHFHVYRRGEIPKGLHYSDNPRTGDILVEAIPPYALRMREEKHPTEKKTNRSASHGYDPDISPEMNGIFYARGPQIRPRIRLDAFRNIHVYPFILQLLGLEIPKDIDGELDVLRPLLIEKE